MGKIPVQISRRQLSYFLGGAAIGLLPATEARPAGKKLPPPVFLPAGPLTDDDLRSLRETAAATFAANRVVLPGGTFHVPSRDQYTSLFAWDSGWHAIALTRLDPALAAAEIEYLLSWQRDDGLVPHEVLVEDIGMKPSLSRAAVLFLVRRQYDDQGRSRFIDPPSFIVAAEKVFAATGDRAWLARLLPRLEHCARYLTHDRDLFGDGLVSIIHPWESGTDTSPVFDQAAGNSVANPLAVVMTGIRYTRMIGDLDDRNWDLNRIAADNRFVFEDLTVNAITIRGLVSLARLNRALGEEAQAERWQAQARAMAAALDRLNWDEEAGCYFSRWDIENPKLARRTTCASLLPLYTGLIPKDRAARLVREHLLDPAEFWGDYVVCFNSKAELAQEKIAMESSLLWRGHCIWMNMNWMLHQGLLEYDYTSEAAELARRTAQLVRAEGMREFYDARTGRGGGAPRFNWPALVLDMLAA